MKVPTVSQIIAFSKSEKSIERLRFWKEKNPTSARVNKKSGVSFANLVGTFFKGGHIPEAHGNSFFSSSENYLRTIEGPVATEINVLYESDKPFKGRLDLLTPTRLIEFKTRNSQSRLCLEAIRDYHLQLAGYAIALESMGYDIQYLQRQIVLVYKDKSPLIIFDNKLEYWENEFKLILNKYYAESR